MYREGTMVEVKEVLRLWRAGLPKKRVAAQLGLALRTVRRFVSAATAAGLGVDAGAAAAGWALARRRMGAVRRARLDVGRLQRMLILGLAAPPAPPAARTLLRARYLRPAHQYALPLRPPGDREESQ